MIYLDNAATTQIHPDVLKEMMPYLTTEYGNAGSTHYLGRRAAEAVGKARKQVADLIGCEPDQIIFTSGGTEANNLCIKGIVPYMKEHGKDTIVTSSIEHDSVLHAVKDVCIKHEFHSYYLDINRACEVNVDGLRVFLNVYENRVGLVSIMHTNNETGSVNPIKELSDVCHEHGILIHTDCVQATGFHNINVKDLSCDFLSISAHKIHAPKGVGALYVKDRSIIDSLISGGKMQEYGLRGGTENVAGIVGFGKACEMLSGTNNDTNKQHIDSLRNAFINQLTNSLDSDLLDIFHINACRDDSKVINIRFDDVDAQTLMLLLDAKGVCVSAGSACRSLESEPSRVLLEMGLSPDEARQSIRISLSTMNSLDEVVAAADILAESVKFLRGMNDE